MLSVGIDLGTTTTQIVFSRLVLAQQGRAGQIPRITIADKQIVHRGKVVFTPLLDRETVDVRALEEILRAEYARAGVRPADVDTGAVIVTGETAKKKNAEQILQTVAGLAGDFVVTVAGPHLESLIAGRGSGAAAYSREHFVAVTNVDIGGGSANMAVFRQGEMVADAAMNFGGRIIEIDPVEERVRHVAAPAQAILDHLGLPLKVGDRVGIEELRRFAECMADLTLDLIEGSGGSLAERLLLTQPTRLSGQGTLLFFSGGIGHYYYDPLPVDSVAEVALHGDVGPLLAVALRAQPRLSSYEVRRPPECMGATVLGASSQTVTLSGSTIWAESELLPLRNVPVIRPRLPDESAEAAAVAQAVEDAVARWDVRLEGDDFAVAIELEGPLRYEGLKRLAAGLAAFASARLSPGRPLVVIIQHDYAQALGQTIKSLLPAQPLLVIDQVGLEEGDYIDIGTPVMDGRAVPLSVKTLVFYSS